MNTIELDCKCEGLLAIRALLHTPLREARAEHRNRYPLPGIAAPYPILSVREILAPMSGAEPHNEELSAYRLFCPYECLCVSTFA